MTLSVNIDGTAIAANLVAPTSIEMTTLADQGQPTFGGFVIDDLAGSVSFAGHRAVTVTESDCAQPRLFTGWVTDRDIGRSLERGAFTGTAARVQEVTMVDLNALWHFRTISGTDGNRPSETWMTRLTWIMGSDYLSGLVAGTAYLASTLSTFYRDRPMDAADYRGSYPASVMDDLVQRLLTLDLNYFAFWDGSQVTAFIDQYGAAVNNSTISISNVAADVDNATCFAPFTEARLKRQPDETWSGVLVQYGPQNKRVYRSRASTATTHIERSTTLTLPFTGGAATATTQAEGFLDKHSVERDRITVTIRVPSSVVGLVQAGQRMNVRFAHIPGYTTATSVRVVSCSPQPINDLADFYDIALELEQPADAFTSSSGEVDPGCCDTNIFTGLEPTVGAGTNTGVSSITGPGYATDGNQSTSAYFAASVQGTGTWIEEFEFALVGTPYLRRVTIAGEWGGVGGFGDTPATQEKLSISFGGTAYGFSYATGEDLDCWSYMGSAPSDPGAVATWDFGVPVSGTSIIVRLTVPKVGLGYFGSFELAEIAACEVAVTSDSQTTLPNTSGTSINDETPTPTPTGTTTTFIVTNPYAPSTILVFVDGIRVPSAYVTETDPPAGSFTLSWAVDSSETITVTYIVG